MSAQQYAQNVLKVAIAQICQRLGWDSTHASAMDVLTDVTQHFLLEISRIMHGYCELNNRTEANLNDLALAYNTVGVNMLELMEYVQFVDPILIPLEVHRFPVPRESNLEMLMPPLRIPPTLVEQEGSVKALLSTGAIALASTRSGVDRAEGMTTGVNIQEVALTAVAAEATITSEDGSIASQDVVDEVMIEIPMKAIDAEESPTAEGEVKSLSKPVYAVKEKEDTEQSPDATMVSEDGRATRKLISVITITSGAMLPVRVGKLPVSRIPIIQEEQPIQSPPAALPPTPSQEPAVQPATSTGSHATLNSTEETAPGTSKSDMPVKCTSISPIPKTTSTTVAHVKYPKKMKKKRSVNRKKKKTNKSFDRSGSRKREKVVARSDEEEGKVTATNLLTSRLIEPAPNEQFVTAERAFGRLDLSKKRSKKRNKAAQRAEMAKTLLDQDNRVVLRQSHMLDYFPAIPKSHQKPPPLITLLGLVGCTGTAFGEASVVPTSMHHSGGPTNEASLVVSSVPRDVESPSFEFMAIPPLPQGKPKTKGKTKRVKMDDMIVQQDTLTPGLSAQLPQPVSKTAKPPFDMYPDTINSFATNPATHGANLNQSVSSELHNSMPLGLFSLSSEPELIPNKLLFPRQDKPTFPMSGNPFGLPGIRPNMSWHSGMVKPIDSKTKLTQTPLDLPKPSCNVSPLMPQSLFQSCSQHTLGTSAHDKQEVLASVSVASYGQTTLLPSSNVLSEVNPYLSSNMRAIDIDHSTGSQRAVSPDVARSSALVTQPPKLRARRATHMMDVDGNTVWICPPCGRAEDGTPMIACDACDNWYHWECVGIQKPPEDNENWYCRVCTAKGHRKRTKEDKKTAKNKRRDRGERVERD